MQYTSSRFDSKELHVSRKASNDLNSRCIFITLKSLCLPLFPGNFLALICADQRLAVPNFFMAFRKSWNEDFEKSLGRARKTVVYGSYWDS